MQLSINNSQFAVFDDFLTAQNFKLVQNWVDGETCNSVASERMHAAHKVFDGTFLLGKGVLSQTIEELDDKQFRVYPTNTGVDIFIQQLLDLSETLAKWIGKQGGDWEMFTTTMFRFPQGSGISWHDDGGVKTGSYAFYTHSRWNVQWGGELLIPDESTRDKDYPLVNLVESEISPLLNSSYDNQKNIDIGVGQYIAPKPNRLVVIAGENPHRVNHVSLAAGNNLRCSLSGCFVRCDSQFN